MEELDLGFLSALVCSARLPFSEVSLVCRHGLWGQNGESLVPSVRVSSDFLEGGQNSTVGYLVV